MKNHHFLFLLLALATLNACKKEPEACFTKDVLGYKVNFDGTCSVNASTYSWDFGDGSSSSIATPQHTYATGGSHSVTLIVEAKGGKTSSFTSEVALGSGGGAAPNANFDGLYSNTETCSAGPVLPYSVVVGPSATRTSEATFNGLWLGAGVPVMAVTCVIGNGGTTFTIARQPITSSKDIVCTTGTINGDGTRINLTYQILEHSSGANVDQCTAVLSR